MSPARPHNGSGRYGWLAMWLGIAGSALVVLGGAWTTISSLTAMSLTQTAQGTKLGELERALGEERASVSGLQSQVSAMRVSLNEIETQFCAEDIVRNVMHESNERIVSAMYEKIYGQRLATDNAYYPVICNRSPYGPTAGSGGGRGASR